jgi:small subunit ribosomal protein S1
MNEQPNIPETSQEVPAVPSAEQTHTEQTLEEQTPEEQTLAEQTPAEQTPQPTPQQKATEGRERAQAAWQRLVDAKSSAETVQGAVKSTVKGGLLVEIDGYRGFLPASQAGVPKGSSLETLVNTTVPLKVIDVDQQRKRVVVSHRRAQQEERRASRAALVRSLKVGEEREATVARLADFGAFVDLGGVDALIPASELAFERVNKPSDVVSVGEKLKVRVLRIEDGGKKIAVSRKGALPDPWRDHAELLRQGKVVEGKVVSKEPRLQIELAEGITGTIGERDANPEDYEIGEAVEVTVRSVDFRNRRLRLSLPHSAASFSSGSFAPLGVELNER